MSAIFPSYFGGKDYMSFCNELNNYSTPKGTNAMISIHFLVGTIALLLDQTPTDGTNVDNLVTLTL